MIIYFLIRLFSKYFCHKCFVWQGIIKEEFVTKQKSCLHLANLYFPFSWNYFLYLQKTEKKKNFIPGRQYSIWHDFIRKSWKGNFVCSYIKIHFCTNFHKCFIVFHLRAWSLNLQDCFTQYKNWRKKSYLILDTNVLFGKEL